MTCTLLSTVPHLKLVRHFDLDLISQVSYVYHNVLIERLGGKLLILSKFYCIWNPDFSSGTGEVTHSHLPTIPTQMPQKRFENPTVKPAPNNMNPATKITATVTKFHVYFNKYDKLSEHLEIETIDKRTWCFNKSMSSCSLIGYLYLSVIKQNIASGNMYSTQNCLVCYCQSL